jgi:hypothetical protein
MCPLNSELREFGFAPRHFNRWALLYQVIITATNFNEKKLMKKVLVPEKSKQCVF